MVTVKIKAPIWNGGQRKVGIADFRMTSGIIKVEITYNDGTSRLFPQPFYIYKEKAIKYPTQNVKGVTLYLIPIKDMYTDLSECRLARDEYYREGVI